MAKKQDAELKPKKVSASKQAWRVTQKVVRSISAFALALCMCPLYAFAGDGGDGVDGPAPIEQVIEQDSQQGSDVTTGGDSGSGGDEGVGSGDSSGPAEGDEPESPVDEPAGASSTGTTSDIIPVDDNDTGNITIDENGTDNITGGDEPKPEPVPGDRAVYVAQIGDQQYTSLADAVAAANSGDTIKLLDDIAVDSYVEITKTLTIDLAGKTLSRNGNALLNPMGSGVTLTVKDSSGGGKVTSKYPVYVESGASFVLESGTLLSGVDGGSAIYASGSGTVTINDGTLTTTGTGSFTVAVFETCTLVVNGGTIQATGPDSVAISDNGNAGNAVTMTINDGTITSQSDIAIYKPGAGTLTLNGGTITGGTGVYVKSGMLVVPNNSTVSVTGTGAKVDFNHNGNGALSTGEAVVIENCNYPGGAPEANIQGGTFSSQNNVAIASVAWNDPASDANEAPITGFVSGGKLTGASSVDTDILAEGKVIDASGNVVDETTPVTTYVAQIGDQQYTNLVDAFAAAQGGDTITMLSDENIDVTGYALTVTAGKSITLDLNGHTVVGSCAESGTSALIRNLGTLTINDSAGNGKLIGGADPTWTWDGSDDYSGSYASNLIHNEGTLVVNGGTLYNASSGSAAYAIDNYGSGKVTINGGTVDAKKASAIRMFYNNGGSVTVTGGTIGHYNSDTDCSYMGIQVMYGTNADVTISGGTIAGMYALYSNGSGDSSVNISDGTFIGYIGFAAAGPSDVSISGGTFDSWVGTWSETLTGFISGGTYSVKPDQACCAEGYVPAANADGTFTVVLGFTVTFDSAGGTAVAPVGVPAGQKLTEPTAPSKEGMVFAGWTLNGAPYDFNSAVNGDITLVATWTDPVAKIGDQQFASLQAALDAAQDGDTVTLLADATQDANYAGTGAVTLDLNGKTLTGTLSAWNGDLTVQGGTITGFLNAYDASTVNLAADATVNGEVVVWGDGVAGETGCKTPTLNVYGTITNSGDAAIATNGTDMSGAIINIHEGATVTSTDDIAIYQPSGNVNVTGGTITGATAIYTKSGALNISGGTVTGNGAAVDYSFYGNGAYATGDAVVVENCAYPNGAPTANITGGTISSANASGIAAYATEGNELASVISTSNTITTPANEVWVADGQGYKLAVTVTVTFVTDKGEVPAAQVIGAGTTATQPTAPTAEGFVFAGWFAPEASTAFDFSTPITGDLTLTAKWDTAVARIGDTHFATLQDAVDAAQAGDTITLLPEAATDRVIKGNGVQIKAPVTKDITIDFNGLTYDIDGDLVGSTGSVTQAFHFEAGSKVTLKNGA
ncbi:MAG: InlB B-repeat-containing protein, partial [Coriobacteriales bacterium]|nr:InlB B-repeat-containing protein [Coriobacteriales bacterium]